MAVVGVTAAALGGVAVATGALTLSQAYRSDRKAVQSHSNSKGVWFFLGLSKSEANEEVYNVQYRFSHDDNIPPDHRDNYCLSHALITVQDGMHSLLRMHGIRRKKS